VKQHNKGNMTQAIHIYNSQMSVRLSVPPCFSQTGRPRKKIEFKDQKKKFPFWRKLREKLLNLLLHA
jgi:hypothetical protein